MENEQYKFDSVGICIIDNRKRLKEIEKEYVKIDTTKYRIKDVYFDLHSNDVSTAYLYVEFFSEENHVICLSTNLGLYGRKQYLKDYELLQYNKGT
jgi:hypothetical protein